MRRWLWLGVAIVLGGIVLIGSRTLLPHGFPGSSGSVSPIVPAKHNGEVSRSELRVEWRNLQKQLAKLRKEHLLNTNALPNQIILQIIPRSHR